MIFLHEQPDSNPSETRTLQDFTKIELQGVIVDAAEHLRAAIEDGGVKDSRQSHFSSSVMRFK